MEIACSACGRVALARPEPVYEGFQKTGEFFVCTSCGHRYPSREAAPFVLEKQESTVFTAADRPGKPAVFNESERRRSCCWCSRLVTNPFGQRCGLTNREVESTDLCASFDLRDTEPAHEITRDQTLDDDPLAKLFGD